MLLVTGEVSFAMRWRLGIYYAKTGKNSLRHCRLKMVKCSLLSPADAER